MPPAGVGSYVQLHASFRMDITTKHLRFPLFLHDIALMLESQSSNYYLFVTSGEGVSISPIGTDLTSMQAGLPSSDRSSLGHTSCYM
jgi:hypothetical protein